MGNYPRGKQEENRRSLLGPVRSTDPFETRTSPVLTSPPSTDWISLLCQEGAQGPSEWLKEGSREAKTSRGGS